MSRLILFNNDTTVPAANVALANVAVGRVYAFDADNMGDNSLSLAEGNDAKRIVFVQGGRDGQHIFSPIFDKADIKTVKPVLYVPPVEQVTTIEVPDVNIPLSDDPTYATVKVTEVSAGFKPHRKFTAEVLLNGKNRATILAEFVQKLNAQAGKFYTASISGNNLLITGKIGVSFETARQESAQGWAIAATQTPTFGSGTAEHAKRREKEAWGQQANFLNRVYLPVEPEGYAEDRTYDFHTFLIPTNTTPNISIGHLNLEVTVAVAAGGSGIDLPEFFFGDAPA